MSFEDKLRDSFRKADAAVPGERIDWSTTMVKARRDRMRFTALAAVATLTVIGIGVYTVTLLGDSETPPISPAASDTPDDTSPVPSPTAAARAITEPVEECSAAGLTPAAAMEGGLPMRVANMRQTILDAATRCDIHALEGLALSGRQEFSYSFGVEDSPSAFWRARERDARNHDRETSEYMRYLVQILELPFCKESQDDGSGTDTELVYYVWPRVHCAGHRTDEDWNDLKGLYTAEQIDQMRSADLYYGFRVGIVEDGDWVYFIAGD